MTTARADLVTLQSAIDAKGQTITSVQTFGSGFTQSGLAGNVTLVAAAAANAPDRVFLVYAFGGQIWVSKGNDATAEPRGVIVQDGCVPVTLKAGEALKVAPASLS